MRPRRLGTQRGQVLPLVALAAIVLFGFAALALDGGLAYSDRRHNQEIADLAALAGAQTLSMSVPQAGDFQTARSKAVEYVMRGLGTWTGSLPAGCSTAQNIDPSSPSTTCPVGGAVDLWVTTPTSAPIDGYDPNHLIQVQVRHHLVGSLLNAAGISNAFSTAALAVAVNPVAPPPPVHVVWATERPNGSNGGGNTLLIYGTTTGATAQVDDGDNGKNCGSTSAPDVFSDEKIHAEGGQQNGALNVNGNVDLSKFDHDQNTSASLLQWWNGSAPGRGTGVDLDPHYSPPTDDTTKYAATNPLPTVVGATVTFSPGLYTKPLTVQPTGSFGGNGKSGASWTNATTFIFLNGVYWFDNVALTFKAGNYSAYSQDYSAAANSGSGGFPTRTAGADGATDGVEFYVTKGATFFAQGGMDNFQAPSTIARALRRPITGTTPEITVFVDANDTGDTNAKNGNTRPPGTPGFVNTPVAVGTLAGYPAGQFFHEQGVVYVQNNRGSSLGNGALVTPGSQDRFRYVVQGQLVAPYVVLNVSNLSTAPALPVTPYCSIDDTVANPANAAKLVQFDPAFIPTSTQGADTVLLQ